MAHLAHPHTGSVSGLHSPRRLVVAGLVAMAAMAAAVALVVILGGDSNSNQPPPATAAQAAEVDAGPSGGTVAAVSRAFGSERVRPGGISLTTNVPALPRNEAGPVAGTASAVAAALSRPASTSRPIRSPTTTVPERHVPDAGPAGGTPAAVSAATAAH